jgi:type I restriction enzyme R subunit
LIEHFRDPERRKAFFKEVKEIEMLYEIISPDAFLRPFIDDYTGLCAIYAVVAKAYARTVSVDREFQRKTNHLVQQHINTLAIEPPGEIVAIDSATIEWLKARKQGPGLRVVNLVKSIEKAAQDNSDDPYLIAMAERARLVQEKFEQRQSSTSEALEQLLAELEQNEARKKQQAERGFDSLTFFVYQSLLDANVPNPQAVSARIRSAFLDHPNWTTSEAALRELRQQVTFALFAACDQLEQVTPLVEALFSTLAKSERLG